jgi:hypothetical protein
MRIILSLLFLCFFTTLSSQSLELKGTVYDAQSGEPLPFASVYFNTTTNGAVINEDGQFTITVDPSFLELIISFIGYKTIVYKVDITKLDQPYRFEMELDNNELEEIEVTSKRGEQWYYNLADFTKNFIGYSTFAKETKILNPEVLQFKLNSRTSIFTVKARAPLQIENNALGYKIEYALELYQHNLADKRMVFLGYPKFIEMQGSKGKQKRWAKRRAKAYNGSPQHFFKSLFQSSIKENGFLINYLRRVPNPNYPTEEEIRLAKEAAQKIYLAQKNKRLILNLPDSIQNVLSRAREHKFTSVLDKNDLNYTLYLTKQTDNTLRLSFRDYWQITYTKEKEDENYRPPGKLSNPNPGLQTSIISMTVPECKINSQGVLNDPLAVLFEQYWSFEKVADMLPLDYKPE